MFQAATAAATTSTHLLFHIYIMHAKIPSFSGKGAPDLHFMVCSGIKVGA